MEALKANKRDNQIPNYVKKQRRKGKIPGILYGGSLRNFMFEIGEMELNKEINKMGEHGLLNIDVDGKTVKTIIKEVQKDPVTHKVLHIDLEELYDGKTVQMDVPLHFTGERLVNKNGGFIQKEKNNVKIQCASNNIPKNINVDLSKLNIGDTVKVCDLEVANEITIIDDVNSVIALVADNNGNMNDNNPEKVLDVSDEIMIEE